MRNLGIDFISVFAMPPVAFVNLAGDLGCTSISIVFEPLEYNPEGYAPYSLRTDKALRREMIAALRDRGVAIGLGEGFIIAPGIEAKDYAADLDIMAELGAQRVNTISFDPDVPRTHDQFAQVVEMAAKVGLPTVTEFAPCFSIPDLPAALAAVRYVGDPNYKIVVDTMHLGRTGGTAADIAALDPNLIGYVQLCDAPLAPSNPDYMEEALYARCVPGEGELPLLDVLKALPRDVIVSVEVPQRAKADAGIGPEARLRHCIETTRRLMSDVELATT